MTTANLRADIADSHGEVAAAEASLSQLRADLRATRQAREQAVSQGDQATVHRLDSSLATLEAQLPTALAALHQARATLTARRRKLIDSLADPFTLIDAGHPLLLLPVRLETRYAWADPARPADPAAFVVQRPTGPNPQAVLLVRIYPDTVHQDSHEPWPTAHERHWQREFQRRLLVARDRAHFVEAWAELVARAGTRRAAYLAHSVGVKSSVLRPDVWSRAARAAGLPDVWFAHARLPDGQEVTATSALVASPLETGPDPGGWDGAAHPTPGGPGMAWMTDVRAAFAAGMALRLMLPLAAGGVPAPVERLAVVGVRVETDAAGGAAALRSLLDAHHYTDGLWLPAHGTPTNGTPAGRPPAARTGSVEEIFQVEGEMAPLVPAVGLADEPGSAGWQAAALLGLDNATFSHVAGADATTAAVAAQVRLLLAFAFVKPLRRLLGPDLSDSDAQLLLAFFIDEVLATGALPAVRTGDQPYGILPLTQVDPAHPDLLDDGLLSRVVQRLAVLRDLWQQTRVPQVGDVGPAAGDPTVDLLEILRSQETTAEIGIRAVLGPELAADAAAFLADRQAELDQVRSDLATLLGQLGLTGQPDLLALVHTPDVAPVTAAWVQPQGTDVPAIQTPAEYLRLVGFQRHPVGDFRLSNLASDTDADYLVAGGRPTSLLFEIARLAVLATADEAARRRLLAGGTVDPAVSDHWDDELPPAAVSGGPSTIAERLDYPDPADPLTPVGFRLLVAPEEEAAPLWAVLGALRSLAASGTSVPVLERVLRNELGLLWHRLDAWYTAIATRRLTMLRNASPTGIHLGGFGVVADLRPERRLTRTAATHVPAVHKGEVYDDAANGGHVHAPSVSHATTAAVLRSAHLGHAGAGHGEAFSVDLSSARTRLALQLLDGIAQSQPLGALLGYRIERALKEAQPDGPSAIARVREVAPLAAGRLTPTPAGTPPGLVAAANVVDGRRLLELAGFGGGSAVSRSALAAAVPALGPNQLDAVVTALRAAGDALDAVGDLLLAEGVFQLVQGNPARSGAASDALSGTTVRPGEVQVAQTPHHGIAVTQRLAVACPPLAGDDLATNGGWHNSARALASPVAEAVARAVLPTPLSIRLRAEATYEDGTTAVVATDLAAANALAIDADRESLGLSALDMVFASVSQQPDTEAGGSALELRLLELIGLADAAVDSVALTLVLERDAAWASTDFDLVQALEICRCLRGLLAESRPLQPADLVHPQTTFTHRVETTAVDAALTTALATLTTVRGDLATAASDLRGALAAAADDGTLLDAIGDIDPTPVRAALFSADALGVTQACPDPSRTVPAQPPLPTTVKERTRSALNDLLTRAAATLAELDRRLAAENAAANAPRPGGTDPIEAQVAGQVAALSERAEAIFGPGFPLAVTLVPVETGADTVLSAAAQPVGVDEASTRQLVSRAALARPAVARLDAVLASTELVRGETPAFAVHQVPVASTDLWAALPSSPPPGGRISLLAQLPLGAVTNGTVAGFLVDEWVEVIPDPEQTTSVAFHYDAPTSAAPNVWLLGVLPPGIEQWTRQTAVAYVDEALALAKLRAVNTDEVPGLGQLLPAALSWDLNPSMAGMDVARLTATEA